MSTTSQPHPLRRMTGKVVTLAGATALAAGLLTAITSSPTIGAASAAETVVLSEDFSGGSLPSGWRAIDGTWAVQNGRLVGTAASGSNNKITFGKHLDNFRFEANVRFESVAEATRWEAFGLDVPADGATPWWIATMRSGSTASNGLEFAQRTTSNTWNVTNKAAAPTAAGTGKDVRVSIEVHGTRASWSFNGQEMLRTTSLVRSAAGVQAFVINGATVSFDNVKITQLSRNGYIRSASAPVTVIAHRGASAVAPENTLAAQDIARRAGADYIENDVQPSSDGIPFILHDSTVDRTTDGTGAIRSLTSAKLKTLDAGSWFDAKFAGEQMPTLAEQLADLRTKGGKLLLEIKGSHTKAQVAEIIRIVRAEGMTGRVFVQSFDTDHLKYVRELAPELPLGLLRSTLDGNPVAIADELRLTSYNPNYSALLANPSVVTKLHNADIAVMTWTADTTSAWTSLKSAGVDGIITNKSPELVTWNASN